MYGSQQVYLLESLPLISLVGTARFVIFHVQISLLQVIAIKCKQLTNYEFITFPLTTRNQTNFIRHHQGVGFDCLLWSNTNLGWRSSTSSCPGQEWRRSRRINNSWKTPLTCMVMVTLASVCNHTLTKLDDNSDVNMDGDKDRVVSLWKVEEGETHWEELKKEAKFSTHPHWHMIPTWKNTRREGGLHPIL